MIPRPTDANAEFSELKLGSKRKPITIDSVSSHELGAPAVIEAKPNFHGFSSGQCGSDGDVAHQLIPEFERGVFDDFLRDGVDGVVVGAGRGEVPGLQMLCFQVDPERGVIEAFGKPDKILTEHLVEKVFDVKATISRHPTANTPLVIT